MKIKKIQDELLKKAQELDIDVSTLKSSHYCNNIYGVEPQYAVGGWEYDENEYFSKQCEKLAEYIIADGLCEYATLSDEEIELDDATRGLSNEYAQWLMSL